MPSIFGHLRGRGRTRATAQPSAEAQDEDEDDEDMPAAEDDEDEDAESSSDGTDAAYARGVAAERRRWSDTLAHEAAAGRVDQACTALADTDLTSAQIVGLLQKAPKARGRLAEAMGRQPDADPGPGGEADASADDGWVQAYKSGGIPLKEGVQ